MQLDHCLLLMMMATSLAPPLPGFVSVIWIKITAFKNWNILFTSTFGRTSQTRIWLWVRGWMWRHMLFKCMISTIVLVILFCTTKGYWKLTFFIASAGLVADDCNPVSIVESVTRPSTDPTTNRPVPRIVRSLYSYNEGVLRLEGWEHPSLTLRNLLDDSTPFPPVSLPCPTLLVAKLLKMRISPITPSFVFLFYINIRLLFNFLFFNLTTVLEFFFFLYRHFPFFIFRVEIKL